MYHIYIYIYIYIYIFFFLTQEENAFTHRPSTVGGESTIVVCWSVGLVADESDRQYPLNSSWRLLSGSFSPRDHR